MIGSIERPAWGRRVRAAFWLTMSLSLACGGRPGSQPVESQPSADTRDRRTPEVAAAPSPAPADIPSRYPQPPRVVAFGDVHGDLDATLAALRLAHAIDDRSAWTGGALVVVQTGDQLDRGDDERAILELFDRLADEATKAGGAFHVLNGNHEIMNVLGDLRYVTEGGFSDFAAVDGLRLDDPRVSRLPTPLRPRAAAFLPGAPYARMLAKRNTVVIVGDTVFAHGGVLPRHVDYGIERINREVRAWMAGSGPEEIVSVIMADDSPVWTRVYSAPHSTDDACRLLQTTLERLDAKRMVVGHTVQDKGITSACEGRVWRVDVGMAKHYGGEPAVLEIIGDEVKIIAG